MKCWSISTTLRSPERLKAWTAGFLPFQGQKWDDELMMNYQSELIRLRAYEPTKLTPEELDAYEDTSVEMTHSYARAIFDSRNYVDAPIRGRQSMSIVRWLGLVRVLPEVRLTESGKALVEEKLSQGDALLNFALKWEVPIANHATYKEELGYSVRPFIGMLALIVRVNKLWESSGNKPVGLSRDEFNLFVPTLINYEYIDEFAKRIVRIRKLKKDSSGSSKRKETLDSNFLEHLRTLPHTDGKPITDTDLGNLRDYGDSAIRYFRPTGFIEFRGDGRYIDVSPLALVEVSLLLENEEYKPVGFDTQDEYLDYMADLDSFVPPWATKERLGKVKNYLREMVKAEAPSVKLTQIESVLTGSVIRGEDAEIVQLKKVLVAARLGKVKSQARSFGFIGLLLEDFENLKKKNYPGYLEAPVALEYAAFRSFLALNDALAVQPNYPVGDDGEPTSTAPGGGTDLYCDYETFSLSVEVTLSRGRSQWVMEGQPVQRHLREIEKGTIKPTYGLFLAPSLYPDTINTFWAANVIGYEGQVQRIIPLNFDAWKSYLEALQPQIVSGELKHAQILKFFDWALPSGEEKANSLLWAQRLNDYENLAKVAVS
jgi:hypothetical protein